MRCTEQRTLMCARMRTAAILHNDGFCGAQRGQAGLRTHRRCRFLYKHSGCASWTAQNGALCNMAASEGARAKLARLN